MISFPLAPERGARLLLQAWQNVRLLGDVEGHEFHGNQWTSGGGGSVLAFHGTSSAVLDSIKQNGLQVSKGNLAAITQDGRKASVFVTNNADAAVRYAYYNTGDNAKPIVLQIHIPAEHVASFVKDEVDRKGTYRFEGDIPPSWIKGVLDVDGMKAGKLRALATSRTFYVVVVAKPDEQHSISTHSLAAHSRETAIHKIADIHITPIQQVVSAAFAKGRAAGKAGAPEAIRAALTKSLPPVLLAALTDAWNASLGMLPRLKSAEMRLAKDKPSVKLSLSFDVSNPAAAKWAREHGAKLAKDISETTRDRIKDAIAREHETGEDAEDDILDAVGNEARAEMIARTESMDAANEGLAQGWSQAVEEGLLTGDERKVWIAAEDPCPECEEVDGEEVPMDEEFSVGDDPPLHPNCRCTMGLVS